MSTRADEAVSWIITGTRGPRPPKPERTRVEISLLRRVIGPFLLLVLAPPFVVLLHVVSTRFNGSMSDFAGSNPGLIWEAVPAPSWNAIGIVLGWIGFATISMVVLPGGWVEGPITPSGLRPRYRNNGLLAWAVTHVLLVTGWATGLFRAADIYREFGALLIVLSLMALPLCALLYLKGRFFPSTQDTVLTGYPFFDFFQGIELHPSLFGIDLKQLFNCRVSMMGWSAIALVMAAHQLETLGRVSNGMMVTTALIVLYLFKFFVWESGYFRSLDIMHDRFGYYLCWGVLVWVPGVYTVASQHLAEHPSDLHPALALLCFAIGVGALVTNYVADAQRQETRARGGRVKIFGRPARTLVATYRTSDGQRRENLLLVSGFWGVSRHFHYMPELMLALAWTLPVGAVLAPYAYVLFLAILLLDRAERDDERCRSKYGSAWDEYCRLVPSRIVPGIY